MHHGRLGLLALVALTMALPPLGAAGQEATPPRAASPVAAEDDARLYDAVVPDAREAVADETADRLSRYRIEATVSEEDAAEPDAGSAAEEEVVGRRERLLGTLDLRFVNDTGDDLDELYLRLYANDARYGEGGIEIRDVSVDGDPVIPESSVGETVARLPLTSSLAPGESATVALAFTTTVVETFDFTSTRFNLDPVSGTITLIHWHPILAGYDPETAWLLDRPSVDGDIVFADAALYDVALTVPPALHLATTGVELAATETAEGVRHEYVTGPARQFAVIAGEAYLTSRREVDGTTVVSHYLSADAETGARIAEDGAAALAVFNDLFGPYPFVALDLVEVPAVTPAGPEFPQLTALDASLYDDPETLIEVGITERLVEFVVAQGVANQWWSQLVGTNHYAHAFLDEAVSDYAGILYVEQAYGPEEAALILDLAERTLYAYTFFATGDQVVDQPTAAFPDAGSFLGTVYGKGTLGFHALRDEIGDDAFVAALRDYADRHRFAIAQPADLLTAFERASERDLAGFWEAWFESAQTDVSILIETEPAEATPTP